MHTNQTSFVTNLLFWNGSLNFEYTSIFIVLSKKITSFYDIGANTGYYSLLATTINPKLNAIAFEPAHGPLHYLTKNVQSSSHSDRIQVKPLAISDSNTTIPFQEVVNHKYKEVVHNLSGEGNLVNKKTRKNFKVTNVKTLTLDKLVETGNRPPDLIKVDTEGAEMKVLRGGYDTISKYRPIIICEVLSQNRAIEIHEFIGQVIEYKSFGLMKKRIVPLSLKGEWNKEIKDMILIPNEKTHLIKEFLEAKK